MRTDSSQKIDNTQLNEVAHPVRHKVFTVVGIVMCVILIPIIIINCTLIAKQFLNKDEVPSVGGVFPMIVLTDSMAGTFDGGSLIVCSSVNAEDVQVGDIICYFDPAGNGTTTTTHRVQEIQRDSSGNISFITKGDANNAADTTPVPEDKLVGKYLFHIAGLGSLAMFMQTTPGLIIFAVLPILILVAYDVVRRRLYDRKKDTETDALRTELEELRAQKAAQVATPPVAAASAPLNVPAPQPVAQEVPVQQPGAAQSAAPAAQAGGSNPRARHAAKRWQP